MAYWKSIRIAKYSLLLKCLSREKLPNLFVLLINSTTLSFTYFLFSAFSMKLSFAFTISVYPCPISFALTSVIFRVFQWFNLLFLCILHIVNCLLSFLCVQCEIIFCFYHQCLSVSYLFRLNFSDFQCVSVV